MIYIFTTYKTIYGCDCSGYEEDVDDIFVTALEHPSSKHDFDKLRQEYESKYSYTVLYNKARRKKENKTKYGDLKINIARKLREQAGTFMTWLVKEKGFTKLKLKKVELGYYYEDRA